MREASLMKYGLLAEKRSLVFRVAGTAGVLRAKERVPRGVRKIESGEGERKGEEERDLFYSRIKIP